jgi:hypothetical protein
LTRSRHHSGMAAPVRKGDVRSALSNDCRFSCTADLICSSRNVPVGGGRSHLSREVVLDGTVGQSASQRHGARHARERVAGLGQAISWRVGGSDRSDARLGDQGRRVGGEAARGRGEAAHRPSEGGRGDKPIGVVSNAEVGGLSVIPPLKSSRRPSIPLPPPTAAGSRQGRPERS